MAPWSPTYQPYHILYSIAITVFVISPAFEFPSSLNTGLFSRVQFCDMGLYDHTATDLDAVAKDIYMRLLPYIGQTVIGKFVKGANYDFISSIGNAQYGVIVIASYSEKGIYLYRMQRGKMYRDTSTWVMTEV